MSQDQAFEVVQNPVQQQQPAQAQQQPIDLEVEPGVAFTMKLQEFDKRIAEAEAVSADLKRQRATFIYETNLQNLVTRQQQKKDQPAK